MFSWQDSNPRIVKFGDNPGGPCGGTHVADISIINSLKVIVFFCQASFLTAGFPRPVKFHTELSTGLKN
jgi:alanyl-tRNA synthetase